MIRETPIKRRAQMTNHRGNVQGSGLDGSHLALEAHQKLEFESRGMEEDNSREKKREETETATVNFQ